MAFFLLVLAFSLILFIHGITFYVDHEIIHFLCKLGIIVHIISVCLTVAYFAIKNWLYTKQFDFATH